MVKLLNKAVEEVISVIQKSDDYQKCLELKEKMRQNKELMQLIENIKEAQKRYIKNGSQDKKEIQVLEEKLSNYPIYVLYQQHLEKINSMISYVQDDLNEFFTQLLNNSSKIRSCVFSINSFIR